MIDKVRQGERATASWANAMVEAVNASLMTYSGIISVNQVSSKGVYPKATGPGIPRNCNDISFTLLVLADGSDAPQMLIGHTSNKMWFRQGYRSGWSLMSNGTGGTSTDGIDMSDYSVVGHKHQMSDITDLDMDIKSMVSTLTTKYAECDYPANTENKVVELPEIEATDFIPANGTHMSVKFVNGHTAEKLTIRVEDKTYAFPVVYNNNSRLVQLQAGTVLNLLFDGSVPMDGSSGVWYIIGGSNVKFPRIFIEQYSLQDIMYGIWSQRDIGKLYYQLMGSDSQKYTWMGNELLIQIDNSGTYGKIEKDEDYVDPSGASTRQYGFSVTYSGKYYAFRISETKLTVTARGLDVCTVWDNE